MEWDGINRRRFLRRKFPFTVHIYSKGKLPISTYTADISEGGIKVVIKQELKIGSIVDLQIYTKEEIITCKGLIAWIGKRESNYIEDKTLFDAGIEYQEMKEQDRLIVKNCAEALKKGEEVKPSNLL